MARILLALKSDLEEPTLSADSDLDALDNRRYRITSIAVGTALGMPTSGAGWLYSHNGGSSFKMLVWVPWQWAPAMYQQIKNAQGWGDWNRFD